jgi:hypothetical protein
LVAGAELIPPDYSPADETLPLIEQTALSLQALARGIVEVSHSAQFFEGKPPILDLQALN